MNRLQISDLKSTFPFPLNFLIDFKNFIPGETSGEQIRIETTLSKNDDPYDKIFDLEGYLLQSTVPDNDGIDGIPCPSFAAWEADSCDDDGWADSPFTTFDYELI